MTSAVEVAAVGYAYGDRAALAGVSFAVPPGELFGVIGPNGSGKSTLFSLLNTSRSLQQGRIAVGGMEYPGAPGAVRSRLGVIFQRTTLDLHLTCRENLEVAAALHGLEPGAARARIAEGLSAAGLADREGELAGALSGGLQRRLELARAHLHLPMVILLDEPFGALDPVARGHLRSRLDTLRPTPGLPVPVTTPHQPEAERCDRLVLLDAGRVVAAGTPAELVAAAGPHVVAIRTSDPAAVAAVVRARTGIEPLRLRGEVRFAAADAAQLIGPLAAACGDAADSVTLGRPTLDDVFTLRTGRHFADAAAGA